MATLALSRLALLFLGCIVVAIQIYILSKRGITSPIAEIFLILISVINILVVSFLVINHSTFPLDLEAMEGVVWQHFQRAALFQPIYPQPTPGYVPLAYNPLYYLLAVPFSWIFGVNLFTLRLVAILGMAGSAAIIYLVIRQETRSRWWAWVSVGLFSAAYTVMDAYLDTAHADSWLLFSALLGTYLIYRNRSSWFNLLGIVVLISSFWFKQHGAFFAIGGLLFITWREGIKRSLLYWVTAILLGPVLYIWGGPLLFGPYFHYFTWEVPRHWSQLDFQAVKRYIGFILKSYPLLATAGGLLVLANLLQDRKKLNIWHFQFIFAIITGGLGVLDPGSSNNVFIPMGTFFIILGTLGLHQLSSRSLFAKRYGVHLFAFVISFTLFLYSPINLITPSTSSTSYRDLIALLKSLDGPVYAPSLGQLPNDFQLYPTAHWVALEDMIRGPGKDTRNNPNTRLLLDPALHPQGNAYILANFPLDTTYTWISFLQEKYVLVTDYGDRFKPLKAIPHRWDTGWPRYLYQYQP